MTDFPGWYPACAFIIGFILGVISARLADEPRG